MEDNCFTMLCWFLPFNNVNQPYVYIYIGVHIHLVALLSLPPTPHPIPPLLVVSEHWVELSASYSKFPLAVYFTYGGVYVSQWLLIFTSKLFSNRFSLGLPWWLSCKESACNARDMGLIHGSGRSMERAWQPAPVLQCSFLKNPMDRGAWWATFSP